MADLTRLARTKTLEQSRGLQMMTAQRIIRGRRAPPTVVDNCHEAVST